VGIHAFFKIGANCFGEQDGWEEVNGARLLSGDCHTTRLTMLAATVHSWMLWIATAKDMHPRLGIWIILHIWKLVVKTRMA
jgi:hypothetical protein